MKRLKQKLKQKQNKPLNLLLIATLAIATSCQQSNKQSADVNAPLLSDTTSLNNQPIFDDPEGEMDSLYRAYNYIYTPELEAAVQSGNADAMQMLASMYAYGIGGVEPNRKKAFQLYRHLAELGDANAQAYIGYMMLYGVGPIEDAEAGLEWLEKSANQLCPTAFYYLSNYFEQTGDTANARVCYQNAIKLGLPHAAEE